jgi:hypothetical protein
VKGDTGAMGLAGVSGLKGDKGDTGLTGLTGPRGPAGPAGTVAGLGVGSIADTFQAPADCTMGTVILSASVGAMGIPADGRLVQISANSALFSLLGTIYGGNGTTTFGVPDLRSVTPTNMSYSVCDQGIYPARKAT